MFALATAAQAEPLPQPLSFQQALALGAAEHPLLLEKEAQLQQAEAELARTEAQTDFDLRLDVSAARVDPPPSLARLGNDDSRAELVASKTLYDFGRTRYRSNSAEAALDARRQRLLMEQDARKLAVMQAYFDVVLSDLSYASENEAMATAYVSYDRVKQRHELGQLSDIDVAKSFAEYQTQRRRRFVSQNYQRESRGMLANALGRPGELPSQVLEPSFSLPEKIPEVESLQSAARQGNYQLRALRAELTAIDSQMAAARAARQPTLNAELRAGEYARELGSSNRWRAAVNFSVPLWQGARVSSDIARLEAQREGARARLEAFEQELDQEVLQLWLSLDGLRYEREERAAHSDYRELYLDRARAIYEMEVKTDLGDAMVQLTAAALERKRTEFKTVMTLARLAALQGKAIEDVVK